MTSPIIVPLLTKTHCTLDQLIIQIVSQKTIIHKHGFSFQTWLFVKKSLSPDKPLDWVDRVLYLCFMKNLLIFNNFKLSNLILKAGGRMSQFKFAQFVNMCLPPSVKTLIFKTENFSSESNRETQIRLLCSSFTQAKNAIRDECSTAL